MTVQSLSTRRSNRVWKRTTCLYSTHLSIYSKEEVVNLVLEDLEINPDREDPLIYNLSYRSTNPQDAATILNNIIKSYHDRLQDQYESQTEEYVQVLKNTQIFFENKYDEVVQTISELRSQVKTPIVKA